MSKGKKNKQVVDSTPGNNATNTTADKPPKFETCAHVQSVGQYAVIVKPSCPRASMIRGTLVSSKSRCAKCGVWRAKESSRASDSRDRLEESGELRRAKDTAGRASA